MRYFLIDTENVGTEWFPILEKSTDHDIFYLFHTPYSAKFSYQYLELIVQNFSKLVQIPCRHGTRVGDSALDFQICTYLGYMIGQNSDTAAEDKYYIVAKDHDYDNVVSFWRFRGYENVTRLNPKNPDAVKSIEDTSIDDELPLRNDLSEETESETGQQSFTELCAKVLGLESPFTEVVCDDDSEMPEVNETEPIQMPFYSSKIQDMPKYHAVLEEHRPETVSSIEPYLEKIPNILDEQIPEPAFSAACENLLNKTANKKKKTSEQKKETKKDKKPPAKESRKDILASALGVSSPKDPIVGNVEKILKQHQYKDLQKIYLDLIKHLGQKKGLDTYQKIKPRLKEYYGQGK